MAEYKTPGVYVEEISTFPASVVRVETAVPIFIGYTELHPTEYQNKAVKVKSLLEYQRIFGGEPAGAGSRQISVEIGLDFTQQEISLGLTYYLYQSLRHFFANGGGDAYILSMGDYSSGVDKNDLSDALALLEKYDEPTLVLVPDAFSLLPADMAFVQKQMLNVCAEMQDRFAILDVQAGTTVLGAADDFRSAVGNENLKYGAAYFPPLDTTLGPDGEVEPSSIVLTGAATTLSALATGANDDAISSYVEANADLAALPSRQDLEDLVGDFNDAFEIATNNKAKLVACAQAIEAVFSTILGVSGPLDNAELNTRLDDLQDVTGPLEPLVVELFSLDDAFDQIGGSPGVLGVIASGYGGFTTPLSPVAWQTAYGATPPVAEATAVLNALPTFQEIFDSAYALLDELLTYAEYLASAELLYTTSSTMANILQAIRNTGYTLPPCGAVAGAYAVTDASRGVWKAPANISLNAVNKVLKMNATELDDLNIPGDGQGKSINAIRFFRGQGNLIYGARTLAGNDNEWRYVPVRRLFIMVEESIRKAIEPFVFESNDANTWIKVKGMIESFLNGIWRDGGLAGAKPEHAYFVKVGLGQTMTAQDILEGKLIIEIGMAAVRPAEFVVLKFSHLLQES